MTRLPVRSFILSAPEIVEKGVWNVRRLSKLGALFTLFVAATLLSGCTLFSKPVEVTPPAEPSSEGMVLWLRADKGIESQDGAVTKWADQSAYGNDAIAEPDEAPVLVENALNGHPVVRFDGEKTFLRIAHKDELNANDAMTVFVVFQYDGSGIRIAQKKAGSGTEKDAWFINPKGGLGVASVRHKGTAFDKGMYSLQTSVYSAAEGAIEIYKNGEFVVTESGEVTGPVVNEDDLYIGKRENSAGQHLLGDIAELIIYGEALSNGQVLDVV